jgi:hypothetical protein
VFELLAFVIPLWLIQLVDNALNHGTVQLHITPPNISIAPRNNVFHRGNLSIVGKVLRLVQEPTGKSLDFSLLITI